MQTPDHVRRCYGAIAREYADRFSGELTHKPFDRDLLARFAAAVSGRGLVCDLGCGPGQTTAFLHERGANVVGLDLSPELVAEAQTRHPAISFITGNMLVLPFADGELGGLVAFYSIVHFNAIELRTATAEMHRVLKPGGLLLLAFHIGAGSHCVEKFLGGPGTLEFAFFSPMGVAETLTVAGFASVEVIERDPIPNVEYPSRRAYLFATAACSEPEARATDF